MVQNRALNEIIRDCSNLALNQAENVVFVQRERARRSEFLRGVVTRLVRRERG